MTEVVAREWAWSNRHDWSFSPLVMPSNPPQYKARCSRCGHQRQGFLSSFEVRDCPGRVVAEEEA